MTKFEDIAAICHDANRRFCLSHGDKSQPLWDDAPDWQKNSAINGVKFLYDNPDAGPSASHESWMAEKVREGWVHGSVKDTEKKTHPCIVPYDQLPPYQRVKDYLFTSIARTLLDHG